MKVNIPDVKVSFSRLVDIAYYGDTEVVLENNNPLADMVSQSIGPTGRRFYGARRLYGRGCAI